MTRPRTNLLGAVASGLVASTLLSCSATTVVTRWQDPAVTHLDFRNVLALVIASDASLRRLGEDELCRQVTRVPCTPAYRVIPAGTLRDVDMVKNQVQQSGFDGAVVLRVVNAQDKVTYVPPSYGPTFWGYYRFAGPAYSPGYIQTDQIVSVETSIYSIGADKLVWVGTTKTMNPSSVPALVKEVAEAVRKELVRTGAIPAPQ